MNAHDTVTTAAITAASDGEGDQCKTSARGLRQRATYILRSEGTCCSPAEARQNERRANDIRNKNKSYSQKQLSALN